MPTPSNRIASDKEILDAVKKHDSRKDAARSLGMAYKTLKNRLSLMKYKQPEDPRPQTYTHSGVSRYFISCAVSDAPIDKAFYRSVQSLCLELNADQVYIPVQYDWQDIRNGKHDPSYPKQVAGQLLSDDINLNDHLLLMGSVPIHATIQNPLTGLNHVSHNKSAIFAHPQRAMVSVATPKNNLPKLLYSTGAVTQPRYTRSKTGRKSQDLHTIGGLLVEVTADRFHVFEITANSDGSFYHLNKHYSGDEVTVHSGIAAIYMADEHYDMYDPEVAGATYFNDDSMVNELQPEQVVRGDVYNHTADNHHNRHNVLNRVLLADTNRHCVRDELDGCFDHIERTTTGGYKNVIVESNHHRHLTQWLNDYNPHTGDPRNALIYHQLNALMIEDAINTNNGAVDPFVIYARTFHEDVYHDCVFVALDEEYEISGVDVSNHGHVGPNGARGSAVNLSLGGKPMVIGHAHSPKIYRNVHQVGASSLDMGYNKGSSGWMTTHCLIYPDGNRTLVHIVDGKWRL